jgi:hypothetical protein
VGQAALVKEKRNAHTILVGISVMKEEVADLDTDGKTKLQAKKLHVRIGFIWLAGDSGATCCEHGGESFGVHYTRECLTSRSRKS